MKKITFQLQDIDGVTQQEKTLELHDGDKLIFKLNRDFPIDYGYLSKKIEEGFNNNCFIIPDFIDVFVLKVGDEI